MIGGWQGTSTARRRVALPCVAMSTILLVADTPWVRNDVEAAIVEPETRIEVVTDPRLAVNAAGRRTASAYLVDMQVGSMGGMAITRSLKEAAYSGSIPDRPVILLLDRSADEFLAKRAGADGWVVKPFTAQELRAVLASSVA